MAALKLHISCFDFNTVENMCEVKHCSFKYTKSMLACTYIYTYKQFMYNIHRQHLQIYKIALLVCTFILKLYINLSGLHKQQGCKVGWEKTIFCSYISCSHILWGKPISLQIAGKKGVSGIQS